MSNTEKPKKSVWKKDVMKELIPEFFEHFRKSKIVLSEDQEQRIAEHLNDVVTYRARIGFFGKTGSGKSSFCNSLFGEDVASISDIAACTRAPQEYLLQLAETRDIVLVDVPGVGESLKRDEEYFALYKQLAPRLDAILWIIKADDRAFTIDEKCWKELVQPYIEDDAPVVVVINQVDKFNPLKEWNDESNSPGPQQLRLISKESGGSITRVWDFAGSRDSSFGHARIQYPAPCRNDHSQPSEAKKNCRPKRHPRKQKNSKSNARRGKRIFRHGKRDR